MRNFDLSVGCLISGKYIGIRGEPVSFGRYYADSLSGVDTPSLQECLADDESSFRRACAEAVISYLEDDYEYVFDTITNMEYTELSDKIRMSAPVTVHRDSGVIIFHFEELETLQEEELTKLVDEVRWGSDTWDCGDFGDVNKSCGIRREVWNRWFGTERRCRIEIPEDEAADQVEIRMYLAVSPRIEEVAPELI